MWVDTLRTEFAGEEVHARRAISSPATPDEVWISFTDGSRVKIEVAANVPQNTGSEAEATAIANTQSAVKWYDHIINQLYADAKEEYLDTDLCHKKVRRKTKLNFSFITKSAKDRPFYRVIPC